MRFSCKHNYSGFTMTSQSDQLFNPNLISLIPNLLNRTGISGSEHYHSVKYGNPISTSMQRMVLKPAVIRVRKCSFFGFWRQKIDYCPHNTKQLHMIEI